MIDILEKIKELKQEREQILTELKEAKINNNDLLFIKSLKNKYHSISNKINYIQDRDNIKEQKKIYNMLNLTPDKIEKKREYARNYQRNIKELIKKYKNNL